MTDELLVALWNKCASAKEFAELAGIPYKLATPTGCRLRRKFGGLVKRMRGGPAKFNLPRKEVSDG